MIDASGIYTPQRAQNIMTEDDIQKVFSLYSAYEDVVEKAKIATIAEIREKDYSLAINNYIEKKDQEVISPAEIRKQSFKHYFNINMNSRTRFSYQKFPIIRLFSHSFIITHYRF